MSSTEIYNDVDFDTQIETYKIKVGKSLEKTEKVDFHNFKLVVNKDKLIIDFFEDEGDIEVLLNDRKEIITDVDDTRKVKYEIYFKELNIKEN